MHRAPTSRSQPITPEWACFLLHQPPAESDRISCVACLHRETPPALANLSPALFFTINQYAANQILFFSSSLHLQSWEMHPFFLVLIFRFRTQDLSQVAWTGRQPARLCQVSVPLSCFCIHLSILVPLLSISSIFRRLLLNADSSLTRIWLSM